MTYVDQITQFTRPMTIIQLQGGMLGFALRTHVNHDLLDAWFKLPRRTWLKSTGLVELNKRLNGNLSGHCHWPRILLLLIRP
jgi:hypothetical protein